MAPRRRQYSRRAVFLECQVQGASGWATISVTDLCVGGCYVDTRTVFVLGSHVTVQVMLAGTSLSLPGRVVHSHPGRGFGMQFDPVPNSTHQLLEDFLSLPPGLPYRAVTPREHPDE